MTDFLGETVAAVAVPEGGVAEVEEEVLAADAAAVARSLSAPSVASREASVNRASEL
jgi:hypothetical protein